MATAHKATEHKTISALGTILSSLNPFKKSTTKSASEPAHTAKPKAKSASHSTTAAKSHKATAKKAKSRKHGKAHSKKHSPAVGAALSEHQEAETSPVMTAVNADPAHAPGHRKMDLSTHFNEATGGKEHYQQSALENNSRGDVAQRMTSPQRRINSPKRTAAGRGVSLPKKSQ